MKNIPLLMYPNVCILNLIHTYFVKGPLLRKYGRCDRQVKIFCDRSVRGLTVKFANSPPCACHGSSGQKPQYGLMTFSYQHFTAVSIYGSLFLSSVY
jgi:hypothetical protein